MVRQNRILVNDEFADGPSSCDPPPAWPQAFQINAKMHKLLLLFAKLQSPSAKFYSYLIT